ncbi:MAG: FecR domain-containing protein [Chitinophagaceae bacterium]|nr:FecR domain-containing protein [Chitinophagaceae bacterium]
MKQLLGETNTAEQQLVQQWMSEDPANQAYYDQLKRIWESSRQLAAVSTVDTDKAWEKFQQRINKSEESKVTEQRSHFSWMKVAAAVILLVSLGWLGYNVFNTDAPVKELLVQTQQQVINDTLSDGSVVVLNKNSSISYPSKFKGDKREVNLKGEAFFNVTPDKKKPFVIDVNDVQVTVVGTSFNIKNHNDKTEVVVETGIVRVTKNGKTVELKAGEKILIGAADTVMAEKQVVSDQLYNYYRTKEFVCDGTPLWKLVDVLNEAYGTNIEIGRAELKNLPMNTTFVNESLDQVLEVIRLTFNIKVTKTGDKIILE